MDTFTLVGIVAVVAFLIYAVYASMRAGHARTAELKALAPQIGMTFVGDFTPTSAAASTGNPADAFRAIRAEFGECRRFFGTTQPRVWNWMRTETDGAVLHLFDYFGGHNPRDTPDTQTLACLDRASVTLPSFILLPIPGRFVVPIARASRVISAVLDGDGRRDVEIGIASCPEFDLQYLLHGRDEAAVRALFTDRVLRLFAEHPGWMIEGDGHRLVLNRFSAEDVRLYWRGAIAPSPSGEIAAAAKALSEGNLGEKLKARAGLPAAEWRAFARTAMDVGAWVRPT